MITFTVLILTSVMVYAGSATYTYDGLNRLIRAEYEDGTVIQYTYDGAGNRTALYLNTTPPITTASPAGGFYNSAQSVTLTCTDLSGAGCDKTYYTTDGTTPMTSSSIYSSPINVSVTTTLKCFSTDIASNNGDLLHYWIESIAGTTPNQLATVWIKFDSIGTGETTFYMYYGEPDATAASNGADTFIFFDDFLVDLSKWSTDGGSPSLNTASPGTVALKNQSGINRDRLSANMTSVTYNVGARIRTKSGHAGNTLESFLQLATHYEDAVIGAGGDSITLDIYLDGKVYVHVIKDGADSYDSGTAFTENAYTIYDILWTSGNVTVKKDGNQIRAVTTGIPNSASKFFLLGWTLTDLTTIDWILLRQYLSTEPARGSWGSEEASE
jgi:YD repeat-containing protein